MKGLTREQLRTEIKKRLVATNETLPKVDYDFPLNVIVEPTNICNLACAMCPSPSQTRARGYMSPDLWKKIVDEVIDKSPSSKIWPAVMGEGLVMGKRFIEMLEYAAEKGANVYWNTNAVLFKEKWIERICALPLREITIGLDATTSEVYDKIRIKGDFDRAVENTISILERKQPKTDVILQFIKQEENFHQEEEFRALWLQRGATVKIRPRLGWGTGVDSPDLILNQDERVGPCPWLIRTISIHWNGAAVQCDADWDQKHPMGDINTMSIEEVWNGKLADRRRAHRNMDFSFELCSDCNDWQAGVSETFRPEREVS
jgi:radical SAM protein with 4Fe4S-binding SPASM domain